HRAHDLLRRTTRDIRIPRVQVIDEDVDIVADEIRRDRLVRIRRPRRIPPIKRILSPRRTVEIPRPLPRLDPLANLALLDRLRLLVFRYECGLVEFRRHQYLTRLLRPSPAESHDSPPKGLITRSARATGARAAKILSIPRPMRPATSYMSSCRAPGNPTSCSTSRSAHSAPRGRCTVPAAALARNDWHFARLSAIEG